ncbi:hypothetical protein QFZ76_003471 [Streptomyces sp. V4I2]|nr:hypothetical protein [Streptomyces sp. V4I2]
MPGRSAAAAWTTRTFAGAAEVSSRARWGTGSTVTTRLARSDSRRVQGPYQPPTSTAVPQP